MWKEYLDLTRIGSNWIFSYLELTKLICSITLKYSRVVRHDKTKTSEMSHKYMYHTQYLCLIIYVA